MTAPDLSIVTPAFNEEANLPFLYQELRTVLDGLGLAWEWIVVDDHSRDGTFGVASGLAAADPRVRCLRLSRNSGAHVALTCGLHAAGGACAVVMAADLQDPPDVIGELLARWRAGAKIVWAARAIREGETASTLRFSRLYWRLVRKLIPETTIPDTGADFFLVDRQALDAYGRFDERNISAFMLINWMGFRQDVVTYTKRARLHGQSGWTLSKKVELVVDSLISFSHLPIRMMSVIGFLVALAGLAYAGWVALNALTGTPIQGWSSLMIVVLALGGAQMAMLGLLGEYMWRSYENGRRRPLYMIEAATPSQGSDRSGGSSAHGR
ncbi:MAG: glycosyltransferase family 2 protein [Phaeospirillum sp.]|nr:glycosyltransferase family 2 protein [Phaeospirillum sp.]